MNAVLVDDDELTLNIEKLVLEDIEQISNLEAFTSINKAIEYMCTTKVDVAFLDIIMEEADGISLAMEVKRIQPECHIVFVSGSRDYALDAFQIYASGYLLKPLTKDDVNSVLAHLGT